MDLDPGPPVFHLQTFSEPTSKPLPPRLSFPAHSLFLGHLTDFFFFLIPKNLLPCLHDQALLGQATVSVDSVARSVLAGDGQSFHNLHMVQPERNLFCGLLSVLLTYLNGQSQIP